jgi:hypothetical protein
VQRWGAPSGYSPSARRQALVLGVLASRILSLIVYQATPKDPVILGGVILIMLIVGIFASLIRARRALAVDPIVPAARRINLEQTNESRILAVCE